MQSDVRDWSDVRVFLAVMRAGSTLAASKTLGIAQPTVARRIEALEHAPGLALFERNTRGFQPTPEAQALTLAAQAIETAATDFAGKARRLIAARSRTIKITADKDAVNHRFSLVVEAFTRAHGDVSFDFLADDDFVDIAAGGADIALRVARKIDDPTLICRKVRDIKFSPFASKGYAAKHSLPRSDTEFGGHRFAVHAGRLDNCDFNEWRLARIDPGQIVLHCDDPKAMEAAVLMGAGIGTFPTPLRCRPSLWCRLAWRMLWDESGSRGFRRLRLPAQSRRLWRGLPRRQVCCAGSWWCPDWRQPAIFRALP